MSKEEVGHKASQANVLSQEEKICIGQSGIKNSFALETACYPGSKHFLPKKMAKVPAAVFFSSQEIFLPKITTFIYPKD
ncbi:hypothetical protein HYU14_03715 [Candidatus Woesearchaeota archaeon]|nr:hypothetical protein [Candidatus Woesearchaeota archaeon]